MINGRIVVGFNTINLSDTVMATLLGTTTLNVLGLMAIVLKTFLGVKCGKTDMLKQVKILIGSQIDIFIFE